jgi:hypothetical protein
MSTAAVADDEFFESDDTPSVGPQRIQSAGWVPTPSPHSHRGIIEPLPLDPTAQQQDFSILGILEAQKGAKLVHQLSLVTVIYNLMKTKNSFDLAIIAENDLAPMIVDFQREGSRWTFLMQAAYWNNESVTRWLFTHNADPYVRNSSNQTALDVALSERNINVAEIIRIKMQELMAEKQRAPAKPIDISSAARQQQLR